MPSVVEVNEEASRHGSLSTDAEPWQRHNGRLSATDRPFVIDSEPPQSETKFEDVVDQVTPCCLINIHRQAAKQRRIVKILKIRDDINDGSPLGPSGHFQGFVLSVPGQIIVSLSRLNPGIDLIAHAVDTVPRGCGEM